MDLHETILARRTVHAYTTDPLPAGAMERALDAAIHAPNHRLTFPWRFVRVGRQTREALADLVVRLKSPPGETLPPEAIDKARAKVLNPAELLVVSIRRHEDPQTAREDYASAACAIQNVHLALWAEGVASKWSSGKPTRHPETYAMFGIDHEREEIVGFVWAGIAAKVPPKPERPPLGELVRALP